MRRRSILQACAAAPLVFVAGSGRAEPPGLPQANGRTFVLVHGSWCGGWFWAPVAERLRTQGHRVFTPTQTGLGERRHLLSPAVTLDTFIEDIVNVIRAEELEDVILVGHSSGGGPVTGVVDRVPERIGHLVYLDAVIQQNGQSFFETMPPDVAAARRKAARESGGTAVPVPSEAFFAAIGLAEGPIRDWMRREMTPHPIGSYEQPLKLEHPVANGRPCSYVAFTSPALPIIEAHRRWARGQPGWAWAEIAAGHAAPVTVPGPMAQKLAEIADRKM